MTDHEALLAGIRAELARSRRDLARIERTLTDGYARVLSLEAERLRLGRRVSSLVATLEGEDVAATTKELSSLARKLEAHDIALKELRGVLGELRGEYSRARRTPASSAAAG